MPDEVKRNSELKQTEAAETGDNRVTAVKITDPAAEDEAQSLPEDTIRGMEDAEPEKLPEAMLPEETETAAPVSGPTAAVHRPQSKRELWESRLLDLSPRNMLLNLPKNGSVTALMSSSVDELEDALADEQEFTLLPVPETVSGVTILSGEPEGKPYSWLARERQSRPEFEITDWPVGPNWDIGEYLREEYGHHRLYTFREAERLEKDLTALYRAARLSQQENGVSSLYIAVGLLRWYRADAPEKAMYAPLVLFPVEMIRKPAKQGYALHMRDEEPHFNTTLLEMLRQEFELEIPEVEPLPADEHGTDIRRVFSAVRGCIQPLRNWEVIESCAVGSFSFARFAMWNDLVTAGDTLEESRIVRSLMKGHVDWDASLPENAGDIPVLLPITADATQLEAIRMAACGSTFVLHGPPGTGKSQTITAMVANLMAQGKKVLFVAEKMAALNVVEKRLTGLGIGEFCMELHSDKASKKHVLAQLDAVLKLENNGKRSDYTALLEKTEAERKRLDEYGQHLHRIRECGFSLRELMDLYEEVRSSSHEIAYDPDEAGHLTRGEIDSHLSLIGQLTSTGAMLGRVAGSRLNDIGLLSYSAEVRANLVPMTRACRDALQKLERSAARAVARFERDTAADFAGFETLKNTIALMNEAAAADPAVLAVIRGEAEPLLDCYDRMKNVADRRDVLLLTWNEGILNEDIEGWLARHENAAKKLLLRRRAETEFTEALQPFAKVPVSFEVAPSLLRRVLEWQELRGKTDAQNASMPRELRTLFRELPDEAAYAEARKKADALTKRMARFPGGLENALKLAADPAAEDDFNAFLADLDAACAAEDVLNILLVRKTDPDAALADEYAFLDELEKDQAGLKDRGLYNEARQKCLAAGLKPVVAAYENDCDPYDRVAAYRKGLYGALIRHIIGSDDVLSSFSGASFTEMIRQFEELDTALMEAAKREIYLRLAVNIPTSADSPEIGRELNLLRKAIGSGARGMSIRELFDRIPHILFRLTPCILMSPNSAAQYLAHDSRLFDTVIFDEASQLPTCKSIAALSRSENAVIVGDPKQMPPTSFFASAAPGAEDLELDDLESILDDALALGIPSLYLAWHYRSTHESLIAFSNREFYENRMHTFPSADDRDQRVTSAYVEGLYSDNVNRKEAEAVIADIIRRYRDPELSKQSVGVVTFNIKQQGLIEDMLAEAFRRDPKLDVWASTGEDPLFVKNLENVQGDERDVILFSTGFGPDEHGRISMNFGPINKDGGGKRLNVAFSRSRISMTIFTSLRSSDIRTTESSPEGLIAFRDFLRYAEGQSTFAGIEADKRSEAARAGVLRSICEAIESRGCRCTACVGQSDFHVDLAVTDPYEPTRYMLGIMLDSEGYRDTPNTRDREIAQIGVLERLGWKIVRVWAMDWWDARDRELARLNTVLEEARIAAEARKRTNDAEARAREEEAARAAEAAAAAETSAEAPAEETPAEPAPAKKTRRARTVKAETPAPAPEAAEGAAEDDARTILAKLKAAGAEFVDKRDRNGSLWLVGGEALEPVIKKLAAAGVEFTFRKGGSRSTGSRDAWFTKSDIELPED